MLDTSLQLVFVDRWHLETSFFLLPFEEMTIILDDDSSLFHLPITSTFFTAPRINHAAALTQVVEDLEVDEVMML